MPEWKDAVNDLHWENFESLKKIDEEMERYV
jgi:hypothetical protein